MLYYFCSDLVHEQRVKILLPCMLCSYIYRNIFILHTSQEKTTGKEFKVSYIITAFCSLFK